MILAVLFKYEKWFAQFQWARERMKGSYQLWYVPRAKAFIWFRTASNRLLKYQLENEMRLTAPHPDCSDIIAYEDR